MKAYRYIAFTPTGRKRRGTVVAETEAEATAQLSRQDLFVSDLSLSRAQVRQAGSSGAWWRLDRRARLSPDLQVVFTQQMAVLLAAELPVDAALQAVRNGGHPALDAVAAQAVAALLDGASLSQALEQTAAGFPPYYLAAVRAGEGAGELAAVFTELAAHLDQLGTDKAQIATALIYPGFVAAVSVLVCGILMVNVAPEIVAMFEISGRPLPDLTRNAMEVADWIEVNWAIIGSVLAGIAAFFVAAPRVRVLRDFRDRICLRLPVIGRLMRLSAAVQYMRTMALILSSKHAVLSAADNAVEVLSVAPFRAEGRAVATAVRQGESLSGALDHLSILPPVARQLIAAGETSARLARMTERAATLVEHRLSTDRKRIAALLEPMLMMVVGGMVLVIVLSVLLPIFDLQAIVTD